MVKHTVKPRQNPTTYLIGSTIFIYFRKTLHANNLLILMTTTIIIIVVSVIIKLNVQRAVASFSCGNVRSGGGRVAAIRGSAMRVFKNHLIIIF